ncbi:hypothetical protein PGIGA_G00105330 [Pangasianodon gigas]|uniref:Uncharacterized protein n=1 Tax=Pangasianodon gigas TaxID=30993 RepID=A0ACC5W7Q2_PANGG|nr:hypothetical protein [Pangasianodon gigas]
MYSSKTQQSLKSGVSPSQAIGSTLMRRKALMEDNSWIKKDREDEPEDKPADAKQSNTANLNTSASSFTKRVSGSQDFSNKNTTPTATKPPVPDKKPALTTQSNSFTARVFSGANSSEKLPSPVKKSIDEKDEKLPVSDPRKEVSDGTDSKIKIPIPPSTTVTSVRKTTETFTTPEKTYPSFASKTETYSKSLKESPQKSPLDMSYNTPQQVNTTEMTVSPTVKSISHVSQSLHAPTNPTPVPSTASRIVGKRDLCSFCAKSIIEGERIILDDLQIFSHTFCFKCDMCYRALGNLEAGDSLWVCKGRVTCANCYIKTKDQWYR